MILNLQTSTFGVYGGIPTYNRLVCRVLNEFADVGPKHVLLAKDHVTDVEAHVRELPNLRLEAYAGNRAAFVRRILSLALSQRIDLALIGHVNHAPLGLLLRRLQPALRYGVIVHGVDVWSRLPLLRRRALRQANFVLSVSEYTKQRAIEVNGAIAERFHLLPNTLQLSRTEPQGVSNESPVPRVTTLLTVCRLESSERYKGVDTVIEALPLVAAQVPDVQYVVIGSGDEITRLKVLAETVGVGQRVHFLGSVDDSALRTYYQACDVFVMPSAKEGFGIVFLEAMEYSKPVVAADRGGSSEVVLDGVTGLLVRYGDVPQLAHALTSLCLDPEQRAKLGRAGYERLQQHFTFGRFRQTLTEILREELPAAAIYRTHSQSLIKSLSAI